MDHGRTARRWAGGMGVGFLALLLLFLVADQVDAGGARVGVRAGYAELDGTLYGLELKRGEDRLFGLQLILPIVSDRLAVQVVGEGTSDQFELTRDGVDSAARGSVDWQDLALYTSLRAEILPTGLFGLYVGAGVGVHVTEFDADQLSRALEDAHQDLANEVDGKSSDIEWHGLGGVALGLGSTIEIFGEGRYRKVEGDLSRDGFAGYFGLNLRLP